MKNFFRTSKKQDIEWIALPLPDDSMNYFEQIKLISDNYWSESSPNPDIYGFQVQHDSKWRHGLSDGDIQEFERAVGIEFPRPLKNFYKTMNGLTKPGVNLFGSSGADFKYSPIYYSYPDDVPVILDIIARMYEENHLSKEIVAAKNISRIFPICGHRFMLIDIPGNPILSIYAEDIIYYAENISKLIAGDIFDNIDNASDFESPPDNQPKIEFWLDENRINHL